MPGRGLQTHTDSPALVPAFAANAPATLGAELLLRIPSASNALSIARAWAPRDPLPRVNDECLVGYDVDGVPWVVTWVVNGPIALVEALPAEPRDGQEVYYLADAANGVVWHLRYRAASASAHKWEFIGGSDLVSEQNPAHEPSGPQSPPAAFAFAVTEWTPGIALALAGDYDITAVGVATAQNAKATDVRFAPVSYPSATLLTTTPSFADFALVAATTGLGGVVNPSRCDGVAAATTVALGFAGSNPEASLKFFGGLLRARPVRVG